MLFRSGSSAQDTVQIYLRQPDCPFDIPQLRLAAFEKVCLEAGESRSLTFSLAADQLRVIDEAGQSLHVPGRIEIIASFSLPVARSLELGAARPVSRFAELIERVQAQ